MDWCWSESSSWLLSGDGTRNVEVSLENGKVVRIFNVEVVGRVRWTLMLADAVKLWCREDADGDEEVAKLSVEVLDHAKEGSRSWDGEEVARIEKLKIEA